MKEIKLPKTITLEYNGKQFVLEFNRRAITKMEAAGFEVGSLDKMPVTAILKLFHGAFIMHHPYISEQVSTEIYDTLGSKKDLIGKLGEMYSEPVMALLDDDEEEGEEKNAGWGASWQ